MTQTTFEAVNLASQSFKARARRWPAELSILLVLLGIGLCFEALGWYVRQQSFLGNLDGLLIMVLQVSEIGLIAIGVTMIIIAGGIDLSSGSVVALSAMAAASLAQTSDYARAVYPQLTDMPALVDRKSTRLNSSH